MMDQQMSPAQWEDVYLPRLSEFESRLEQVLEPFLEGNRLFSTLPYAKQWELRTILLNARAYLNLYDPTANWFVQNNLHRYMEKLSEMKNNMDEVILLMPSPGLAPQPVAMPTAQQAEFNKKALEIMQASQKASFEHYQNMYALQQKITDSINRF